LPGLTLPIDYHRPEIQSFDGAELSFHLGEQETAALNEIAVYYNATLFMLLATIYNILLSRLSGAEDIIVGTPTAGRRHVDLMQIVGMFVNTLPLRNYPGANKTVITFLEELKENTLAAFENQDYQFETLVERLEVPRDTARNPLFDAFFSMQNIATNQEIEEETTTGGEPVFRAETVSKFDISLNCIEEGKRLRVSFQYCTKLFKQETILRICDYFKRIVSTVIFNPKIGDTGDKLALWNKQKSLGLSEIEILSPEEKHRLIYEFNDTAAQYPKDKTINRLFEEQAEKTPDNIATVG
ncbi:MAG: non-ribosomal peptide synthetase, partial [bacterium]|nr:non-ribosomal peptide synthetase [bacterium]